MRDRLARPEEARRIMRHRRPRRENEAHRLRVAAREMIIGARKPTSLRARRRSRGPEAPIRDIAAGAQAAFVGWHKGDVVGRLAPAPSARPMNKSRCHRGRRRHVLRHRNRQLTSKGACQKRMSVAFTGSYLLYNWRMAK